MKISFGWDEAGEPTVRVDGKPVARACDCPGYAYVQTHVLAYPPLGKPADTAVEVVELVEVGARHV